MLTATNLTLRDYLETLRRQWLVIVVVTIVAIVVGTVPAALQDPVYASTAQIQVRSDTAQSPFDSTNQENASTRSRELSTDVELLQSSSMRALVSDRLGPNPAPYFSVSAANVTFSEIISIRVTAPTPGAAADTANAFAEAFVDQRRADAVDALVTQSRELRNRAQESRDQIASIDQRLADPATDPRVADTLRLERSAAAAQVLEFSGRADELDVEAALREGGTRIVSRAALVLAPISPHPIKSATIAAVLGSLVAIGLAVVLDTLQDRVSGNSDLEGIDPTIPVLSSIPHLDPVSAGDLVIGPATEAYRYLLTSIRFLSYDSPVRSLAVTSATPGEGKTTTAVNLARAAAESGSRVVLIDADLRKPSVHEWFGLDKDVGLGDVLTGDATVEEAMSYVEATLAVLPAGQPSALAPELLGGRTFLDLVRKISKQCDLVVIDTPPVLPVADPLLVAKAADCVLVVARIHRVRRRELREVLRRIREARIRVGGFVANDSSIRDSYGEYRAYASEESPPPSSPHAPPGTRGRREARRSRPT